MNSICIATYNGEKYIKEQLLSILNQINDDDEVIISDDGSTDNTLTRITELNDDRITIIHNSGKKGCIYNFENALKKAKGDIIFLADQDDVWLENKYNIMLEQLNNTTLVASNSIVTDDQLTPIYNSFFEFYSSGSGIFKNIIKSTYFGSCMAFHRELLNYALPFPNSKEIGHDLWLGLIAELVGNVKFIPEKLIYYRRTESSFCQIGQKSNRSIFRKIYGRFIMIKELINFTSKHMNMLLPKNKLNRK